MRIVALSLGLALALAATTAQADPKDYRFEPVSMVVPASAKAPLVVKLVHLPDGKPVNGAVIYQSRLEMPMPGMAPMTSKLVASGTDNGTYSFFGDVSMAGAWQLVLAAKVQGETGTVTGTVPFTVVEGGGHARQR